MNEPYSIKTVQLGNLTRYQVNSYRETSIVNHTSFPIVVIDHENQQQVIPPVATSGLREDVISIYIRGVIGPTLNSDSTQVAMDGLAIQIERYKLRNEPVYVKELNVLICTEEQATSVKHPFSQVTYDESLEMAIDKFVKLIDEAPSFKLLANDPTHSFTRLWTMLDDNVVSVPVTHAAAETPTLSIVTIREGRVYTESISLEDLIKSTDNIIKFNNKVIPWVTTSQINATELARTFKWITPDQYDEMRGKLLAENKKNLEQVKSAHEAKILDLTTKVSTLESTIRTLEQERDEYKAKYTSFKADSQLSLDRDKQRYAYAQLDHDERVSNNNMQTSDYKLEAAKKESDFKWLSLGLAAVLPIVGVVAMKMFESSNKK